MLLKHLLPCAAAVAILAGCATEATKPVPKAPATASAAMAEADIAFNAGLPDKGVELLKAATVSFPAEKQPWLKLAQYQFDTQAYGKAIVSAQEVLQRDADEQQAHSLIAVASLRLSMGALNDLAAKNNLSGNVRSEAQELAKLLRARVGDGQLVKPIPTTKPVPDKGSLKTANASKPKGGSGNWFDNLK
jgi:predicted Zn-dependent protease